MRRHLKPSLTLALALLSTSSLACRHPTGSESGDNTSSATTTAAGSPMIIQSNTQAQLGEDVRVAAFNFADDSWQDDAGATQKGRTCAVQFFVRDKPDQNQKLRVHKGQTFQAAGHSFEVLDVTANQLHLAVK